jgi:hypothetical protein
VTTRRRWLVPVLTVLALLALVGIAGARPGGGDSFSGGGGHGGGSGGGDGADWLVIIELVIRLIFLCIDAPWIGLPIVAIVVVFVCYSAWKQHKNKDWDSGPPLVTTTTNMDAVRRHDPDFSQIVFEDFLFRLYSSAHRARHSHEELAKLAPYLSTSTRATLAERDPRGVTATQVIIGAMRVVRCTVPGTADARTTVTVELEANIAYSGRTLFVVEQWTLGRDASVKTKPPTPGATTFPCPHCGAPWQTTNSASQQCASCAQVVDNGRFDWIVESVSLSSSDARPPTLTTEVPERGTDLPTYKSRDVDQRYRSLQIEDPAVDQRGLDARIALIHKDLAAAWSKNELAPVRGLVSDGLYDYLDYWVHAYKQQGLVNMMADLRITKSELAKVVRDRWYDAVTMRIWATGKDYVIDAASGRVRRGSKRRERPYSEYWTLIRAANRKGPTKADRTCGNCGAPLKVSMSGSCDYCGAHVTGGEFDWVLSKIEQDDSYRG